MYYVILKEKEYEKNIYIIWILSTHVTYNLFFKWIYRDIDVSL